MTRIEFLHCCCRHTYKLAHTPAAPDTQNTKQNLIPTLCVCISEPLGSPACLWSLQCSLPGLFCAMFCLVSDPLASAPKVCNLVRTPPFSSALTPLHVICATKFVSSCLFSASHDGIDEDGLNNRSDEDIRFDTFRLAFNHASCTCGYEPSG